ncbi:MAG: hypothetical protein LC754_17460 [Acidobacteria bacterium]|nr:hypothetical protein [Acidobacteriota bacterium]
MTKSRHGRFVGERAARLCGSACVLVMCAFAFPLAGGGARVAVSASGRAVAFAQEDGRMDIRLRSFTPGASGRLTIEPSEGGGRGRLTALNLPDPQTLSPGSTTYVVWVTSGGRIINLGELHRDERGNGGLAFEHPADFDRFTIIVTAETRADVERPGAPVLSTRANEAVALYPSPARDTAATAPVTNRPPPPPPLPRAGKNSRPRRLAGDFYTEVDDALVAQGGGRVIELEGTHEAPKASGSARAATHTGSAYVRANFRGVPLPSTVGAATYVLWAIVPDGRMIYMGSLPVTDDLNHADIYVRTAGFGTDIFDLFVTAERRRPVPVPSDQRVLTNKATRLLIK